MSGLLFWMADNIAVWRPVAVMVLAAIAAGCVYFAVLAYGDDS